MYGKLCLLELRKMFMTYSSEHSFKEDLDVVTQEDIMTTLFKPLSIKLKDVKVEKFFEDLKNSLAKAPYSPLNHIRKEDVGHKCFKFLVYKNRDSFTDVFIAYINYTKEELIKYLSDFAISNINTTIKDKYYDFIQKSEIKKNIKSLSPGALDKWVKFAVYNLALSYGVNLSPYDIVSHYANLGLKILNTLKGAKQKFNDWNQPVGEPVKSFDQLDDDEKRNLAITLLRGVDSGL